MDSYKDKYKKYKGKYLAARAKHSRFEAVQSFEEITDDDMSNIVGLMENPRKLGRQMYSSNEVASNILQNLISSFPNYSRRLIENIILLVGMYHAQGQDPNSLPPYLVNVITKIMVHNLWPNDLYMHYNLNADELIKGLYFTFVPEYENYVLTVKRINAALTIDMINYEFITSMLVLTEQLILKASELRRG